MCCVTLLVRRVGCPSWGCLVPVLFTFLILASVEDGEKGVGALALVRVAEMSGIGLVFGIRLTLGALWIRKMVMSENFPGNDTMVAKAMTTVVFSIMAHGLTANPLAAMFGARSQPKSG